LLCLSGPQGRQRQSTHCRSCLCNNNIRVSSPLPVVDCSQTACFVLARGQHRGCACQTAQTSTARVSRAGGGGGGGPPPPPPPPPPPRPPHVHRTPLAGGTHVDMPARMHVGSSNQQARAQPPAVAWQCCPAHRRGQCMGQGRSGPLPLARAYSVQNLSVDREDPGEQGTAVGVTQPFCTLRCGGAPRHLRCAASQTRSRFSRAPLSLPPWQLIGSKSNCLRSQQAPHY